MTLPVILSPEAEADLDGIYSYIADRSGADRAFGYLERIIAYIESFARFPERGQTRDDLRAGLRVIGFERRVSIAFHVTRDRVVIDRVLYGGRDLASALGDSA